MTQHAKDVQGDEEGTSCVLGLGGCATIHTNPISSSHRKYTTQAHLLDGETEAQKAICLKLHSEEEVWLGLELWSYVGHLLSELPLLES